MRAVLFDRYGAPGVLYVGDVPEPAPGAGEVTVRVRAASLNPLDWKVVAGELRFLPIFRGPPRGTGCDFAGEIVGVGAGAAPRHVGERVFGAIAPFQRGGTCAEIVAAPVARIAPMPDGLDFAAAAALPVAGGTALQALTDVAGLAAGGRVVVTGAAGGVGHFAVQVAKHLGAHVVAVCGAANAEFVRSLGADEVVDYAREDFTRRPDRFDVVFDAAGASSFGAARAVMGEAGCYVNTCGTIAGAMGTTASAVLARLASKQRAVPFTLKANAATWERLARLVLEGALRPSIVRTVPLEGVADALASMATGHGRGKVVVVP